MMQGDFIGIIAVLRMSTICWTRPSTRNERPQYFSMSRSNHRPRFLPLASRVPAISAGLRTRTQSPRFKGMPIVEVWPPERGRAGYGMPPRHSWKALKARVSATTQYAGSVTLPTIQGSTQRRRKCGACGWEALVSSVYWQLYCRPGIPLGAASLGATGVGWNGALL